MAQDSKLTALEMGAVLLVVIGGLNWLLVGLFDYNLVATIFGDGSTVSRVVYSLVGVSALYVLIFGPSLRRAR
ncbi:MAG: DUF378 domain-containing protein [bacterium]|nr:DUF378 domain-containing protein [bacterium]MDZ4248218.1 DUF378 domain-containing protein [Patescibacteria group bacterium]